MERGERSRTDISHRLVGGLLLTYPRVKTPGDYPGVVMEWRTAWVIFLAFVHTRAELVDL